MRVRPIIKTGQRQKGNKGKEGFTGSAGRSGKEGFAGREGKRGSDFERILRKTLEQAEE